MDDRLLLEVVLNHPGTMRSSVVVHKDELKSDCTSGRSNVYVQDLIPVVHRLSCLISRSVGLFFRLC